MAFGFSLRAAGALVVMAMCVTGQGNSGNAGNGGGGKIPTCADQVNCIHFTATQTSAVGAMCNFEEAKSCYFEVCMEITTGIAGCPKEDTISHSCVKNKDQCPPALDFDGATEKPNVANGDVQCQMGEPGGTVQFLLKDSDDCGADTVSDVAVVGGGTASCAGRLHPDDGGVESCTGNAPLKECIWTVQVPTCDVENPIYCKCQNGNVKPGCETDGEEYCGSCDDGYVLTPEFTCVQSVDAGTCKDQWDCFDVVVTKPDEPCGNGECYYDVCVTMDFTKTACVKKPYPEEESFDYACVENDAPCPSGLLPSFQPDKVRKPYNGQEFCQTVLGGQTARFVFSDGTCVGEDFYPLGSINIKGKCRDESDGADCVLPATEAIEKDCIWLIEAPACEQPPSCTCQYGTPAAGLECPIEKCTECWPGYEPNDQEVCIPSTPTDAPTGAPTDAPTDAPTGTAAPTPTAPPPGESMPNNVWLANTKRYSPGFNGMVGAWSSGRHQGGSFWTAAAAQADRLGGAWTIFFALSAVTCVAVVWKLYSNSSLGQTRYRNMGSVRDAFMAEGDEAVFTEPGTEVAA